MMSSDKLYQEWNCSDFTKITPISKLEEEIRLKFYNEGDWSLEYYKPVVTIMDKEDSCRYRNFLDSSIWFYMCDNSKTDLSYIEEKIKKNKARYWLKCALEYRDFYTRMLANNFVNGDHKKFVFPFLFHSEKELKRKKEDTEHIEIINEIKKYRWRILLVDDHTLWKDEFGTTQNPLTPNWYTQDAGNFQKKRDAELKDILNPTDEELPTKLDIVVEELRDLFEDTITAIEKDNEEAKFIIATEQDKKDVKENANIFIECATTIEEAQNKLKEKKYEIILLDYLLGNKVGGGREYGYELLDWIYKQETAAKGDKNAKLDYKKGPDNRFYFMFISAFTTAVSERLLTEGWHRSEDYWYIGEGACPINTPYLFQYRLLHIMEKRMKDMNLQQFDVQSWLDKEIFSRTSPRKEARDHFKDALNFMCEYEQLEKDYSYDKNVFNSTESVMVTNFLGEKLYPKAVFEHVVQLVYLTAFGTVRQWPEMWEEYQFIQSVVGRIQTIESYIIKLKNNQIE